MRISDWSSDVCSSELVGKTNGFPCKPCCQFSSPWAGEVAIVVAPLDNGELFVPGLNAARELRDNISFNANLLGDMVEHDRREQFAFAKVTPGIAQATELERIAKTSFWGPGIGNGGKVGGIDRECVGEGKGVSVREEIRVVRTS